LQDVQLDADNCLFSLKFKHVLTAVSSLVLYNKFFTCVAYAHRRHARSDEESQENTEIPRRHEAHGKVLVATPRQYWRKNTETTHQHLV